MPTILSHPAVALGLHPWLGRGARATLATGALLTILPDVDTIGFAFGVPYDSPFGHRGFTHSIAFAVVTAGLGTALLRTERRTSTFVYLFLCALSHGLLDACTDGGRGVGFLIPLDDRRFFFHWRPVAVSPIGAGFFSSRGIRVLLSEARWLWLPSAVVGLTGWFVGRAHTKRS